MKPFGTVHAVLCAESVINEPFCVLNADDYYGVEAYQTILGELKRMPESGCAKMVAYQLKNTASIHGTVSRGICEVESNTLKAVRETKRIPLYEDGSLKNLDNDELLDPEILVSMNFLGFTPGIFPVMRECFNSFLRNDAGSDIKAECLLPVMVDDLMKQDKLTVSVLHSAANWFGVTYQEDKMMVAAELKKLHEQGAYPPSLRG